MKAALFYPPTPFFLSDPLTALPGRRASRVVRRPIPGFVANRWLHDPLRANFPVESPVQ